MDVIELLTDDHERILRLLKKVEKQQSALERRALFDQMARDLRNHAMVEEKMLYPAIKEDADSVVAAHETHLIAARLLREMEATSPADDRWAAKLKVLRDILAHHVKEEHDTIFPKIKQMLDRQERDRIGMRIEDSRTWLRETSHLDSPRGRHAAGAPVQDVAMVLDAAAGRLGSASGDRTPSATSVLITQAVAEVPKDDNQVP